ncbi:MAG: hypothetical protein HYS18_13745 [Burkholderiales bacterium]|nr:hypothetical protein [Burkholderiales bacterium]
MSDRPNGQDLLLIAREELVKRLLPELPPSLRYEALMIANAMAIAAREFESGRENDVREIGGLRHLLLGESPRTTDGEVLLDHALKACRKKLCEEIRAGEFDPSGDKYGEFVRYLKTTVTDKVGISNPKLVAESKK